jgi:hypothetical protein
MFIRSIRAMTRIGRDGQTADMVGRRFEKEERSCARAAQHLWY